MKREDFYLDNKQWGFNIFYKGYCVYQHDGLGLLRDYYAMGQSTIDDFISGKIWKRYMKMVRKIDLLA